MSLPKDQEGAYSEFSRALRFAHAVENVHAEARYFSSTPQTVTQALCDLEKTAHSNLIESEKRLKRLILEASDSHV